MDPLRIAIVGAGRMGRIRAASACAHPACRLTHVVDTDAARARALAGEAHCAWETDWEQVVSLAGVDAVVVSTAHKFLMPVARAALEAGKHVFCEKPMARTSDEGRVLMEAAEKQHGRTAMIGFTLRQHPAIVRAHQLVVAALSASRFISGAITGTAAARVTTASGAWMRSWAAAGNCSTRAST